MAAIAKEVQRHVNAQITEMEGRNTTIIFYDVTNFYFEIDSDELRRYGISKEGRRDPIVQMGLAMDADGIPLHYDLFPGNTLDNATFRPVIGEIRKNYGTGRIIVVADKGLSLETTSTTCLAAKAGISMAMCSVFRSGAVQQNSRNTSCRKRVMWTGMEIRPPKTVISR